MSERSLRNWRRAADLGSAARAVGRPPATPAERERARRLVAAELERQGSTAGEGPIAKALAGAVSRWRVRQELAELKALKRREERLCRAERRQSVRVLCRDALWVLDATALGRDEQGRALEAEVLRGVAAGRTLELSLGRKACAADVLALLERAARARGGRPLVLGTDNGSAYVCAALSAWCKQHQVVQLKNLPRTPEHNAPAERGIGELKREALVRRWPARTPLRRALAHLVLALERLDHARLRRTRGWKSAAQADLVLPHWRLRTTRGRFFATARCAIRKAVLDSGSRHAARRAERAAILQVLADFKLIQWTRGTDPPRAP